MTMKNNTDSESTENKVVHLNAYRSIKKRRWEEFPYRYALTKMEKPELLHELLKYHDKFKNKPNDIRNTIRGQFIMEALEERSELSHLQDIARDFQQKLKVRLYEQIQKSLK